MDYQNVIEINNVSKTYNLYKKPIDRLKESLLGFTKHKFHTEFQALDSVSFNVRKGECFGIIGVNGAGKSTILKIITGVLSQTHGDVKINGKISALLELGAGFNQEYTGIENIYMNGLVLGYTKEQVNEMIPKIKEFADIGDFINQPVKLYSSGMFARLAFAVAINVDPDILIVDEALSVGDIFFQAKCYKKFEEFKALGKTILFVTHDMTSVLKYCDRVMVMNHGNVISIGKPDEMVNIFKKILANTYDENAEEKAKKEEDNKKEIDNTKLWKDSLALNPKPNIYGNGIADIIDFGIFDSNEEITNAIKQSTDFKIRIKARFNKETYDPIFAFTIKNVKGQEITGSNTWYEGVSFGKVLEGEEIIVEFKLNLPISVGQYLLDLGITKFEQDNLTVLMRQYEITTIDIISTRNNVGFVNPNCDVTIKRGL